MASCQPSPITPLPVSKSEEPKTTGDAPAKTSTSSEIKKVSPILDVDLTDQFRDIFKESTECRGITFYTSEKKAPPNFKVQIKLTSDDARDAEPEWSWTVRDARKRRGKEDELRGIGNQTSAALAIRDVCITVWENMGDARKK